MGRDELWDRYQELKKIEREDGLSEEGIEELMRLFENLYANRGVWRSLAIRQMHEAVGRETSIAAEELRS
jgi:hypothetical protein